MTSPDDKTWCRTAVERFEGPLVRYATRITGDLERGRDVVQDTFVRLCEQPRAAVEGHLAEWLYTVCRNRALDVRRKEGRMTTTSDESGLLRLPSRDPGPEAASERREAVDRALDLIESLPARQQEVLRLKFGAGLSYKEISRITSHSVSYVGVLIHTGMKALRAQLATSPEA